MTSFIPTSVRILWKIAINQYEAKLLPLLLVLWFSYVLCKNVGPLHGVQSFRNALLQCESPAGHTSCQKTCSYMATSQWATSPVRSLLWCGLSKGCGFLQSSSVGSLLLTSPMWLHIILYKVIDRSMFSAFVSHIGFGFCFFSFTLPFAVCSVFLPFSPVNYSHFPMCKGDF